MARKPMTKNQILNQIAGTLEIPKSQVSEVINELVNLAYSEAKVGFTIPGLGKLVVVHRKKRKGRNPATGESIMIPAKKALKFRISKIAKDNIL